MHVRTSHSCRPSGGRKHRRDENVHWRPDRRCLHEQHRRHGSLVFSDGPVILLVQRSVPDASNLGVVCYVNILGRSSGDVERSVEPLYLLERTMSRLARTVLLLSFFGAVAGCSSSSTGTSANSSESGETTVATGSAAALPTAPPQDTYASTMIACMASKGWTVERNGDDGIKAQFPPDQFEQATQDQQDCVDETGFGIAPLPPSEQQLRALYDARVEQRQCLMDAGFAVSDPPSVEVFVQSGGAWSAFLVEISPDELDAQREACPDPF